MPRRILAAAAVVFVAMQLVPVDREAPAADGLVEAPPAALAILERACFDCHSNRTEWPWYSYVAPVSWLVADDVEEGREHVDFTRWNRYDARARAHLLEEIVEEVEAGEMPLAIYRPLHPDAEITDQDLATLRAWARAAGVEVGAGGEGHESHESHEGHE